MTSIINGYDVLLGLSTEIEQVEAQHQDQFDSVDQMYDRANEQLPDADVQSSVDQVQLDQSLAELSDRSQQVSQSESEHGESADADASDDADASNDRGAEQTDTSPKSDHRQLQQPMSKRVGQHIDLPSLQTSQSSLNPIVTHQGEMNQSVNRAAQPGALMNNGYSLADQMNHAQVQTIGHGVDQVRVRKSPPIDQSEGTTPLSAGVSALQHDVGSKQEQIDRTVESLMPNSDVVADVEPKTDVATETKAEAEAETETVAKPETQTVAKPETKAESQSVSQPQIKVVTPTITINHQLVNLADLPQTLTGDVTLAYDQQNNQVQIEFTKRQVDRQQDQQSNTQQRSDDQQQHTDHTESRTPRTRESSAQLDAQRFVDSLNVIRQQFNSKHQDTKIQPLVRVDAVAQPVASYLIRTDQPVATDKQCLVVLHQYLNQHPQVAKAAIYASAVSVHISQLTQPMKLSIGSLSLLSLKQAQTAIKLDFAQ